MRSVLETERIAPGALQTMASFHTDIVANVKTAVARDAVVVVGMAQNLHVKKTRKALQDAGIAFTYLEYGGYLSEWKKRLAIKLWTGWPTFPQVFVKGTLIGGAAATRGALADGSLKARLGQT
jgi:glutaredoxin-related protein